MTNVISPSGYRFTATAVAHGSTCFTHLTRRETLSSSDTVDEATSSHDGRMVSSVHEKI